MLRCYLVPRAALTFFRTLYVLPWLLTVAIIAVLWRLILNPNGVANYLLVSLGVIDANNEWLSDPNTALVALCVINIWAGYPFFMISLLAGLQGIPTQLYEAAEVDGAGAIRKFLSITLPQLRPILISMALLDVIWTSQQFALIWMTTGGGPIDRTEVLPTYTYKLAFSTYQFSLASASAVIILILSMIMAAFYVRHQKASN
ncbi:sugar ABC transporter permease [Trueperella pyogenes]|uniref:carbohydrate ABC transporter permease n=1 Tax=Trueperella pyogenes TaxID=1661 RepID=UPI002E780389|nr:sugar ABC transporter permease [Trueperella pyogenes]